MISYPHAEPLELAAEDGAHVSLFEAKFSPKRRLVDVAVTDALLALE